MGLSARPVATTKTLRVTHSDGHAPRRGAGGSASTYLTSLVTRGTSSSLVSLKMNIQTGRVQAGACGLASSSRLPSLSRDATTLARRGVTTLCTRFHSEFLQHEETGPHRGLRHHSAPPRAASPRRRRLARAWDLLRPPRCHRQGSEPSPHFTLMHLFPGTS